MQTIYINRNGQGHVETVDEADSVMEALELLAEYRLADPSAQYYKSSRPCAGWED